MSETKVKYATETLRKLVVDLQHLNATNKQDVLGLEAQKRDRIAREIIYNAQLLKDANYEEGK